jgi:hypothetical protein
MWARPAAVLCSKPESAMRLLENDSRGKLWGSIRSYSFRPGDRVLHDKFGRGTILMVADNGSSWTLSLMRLITTTSLRAASRWWWILCTLSHAQHMKRFGRGSNP